MEKSQNIKEVQKIEEFKKSMSSMKDNTLAEIAEMSSDKERDELFERIKAVSEEEINKLSAVEINRLLGSSVSKNLNKKVVSPAKRLQFKKDYVLLLKSYDTFDKELDELTKTFEKDQEKGKEELKKLIDKLSGTSVADSLNEIIDSSETNDSQKQMAKTMKQALQDICDLKLIKDALLFKGDKLRKEYKRDYDKYKEKLIKLTKNSKIRFVNPTRIEDMMFSVYPEKKEQCKMVLYILYRHYARTKNISEKDSIELNYYIVAIMGLKVEKKSVSFDNIKFKENLTNIISKLTI